MKRENRQYQTDGVAIAFEKLKKGSPPFIIQAATGAGKSVMIADLAHKLDAPTLILQPSKELLLQNYEKLVGYGVEDVSLYSASVGKKDIGKYTYATIGSIYKKADQFKHIQYVIIDECHLVNPKNLDSRYSKFLKEVGCDRVVGFTATPYRMDSKFFYEGHNMYYTSYLKMLNRLYPFFFKSIVYKIETQELIDQGYLSPVVYHVVDSDLRGLKMNSTGADFDKDAVEAFWSNDIRMKRLCAVIQKIDEKAQANLIFCSSMRQANKAQKMLAEMGIDAALVSAETKAKERDVLVEKFRNKELKHMINVGVFTTGFDVPHLDCVVLARPTMSLALYYQMVGRGIRKDPDNPDKVLRVYDLAGVVERLGRVETIRVVKEPNSFKDKVISEVGDMTEVPLFKFLVKKKVFAKDKA